MLIDNSKKTVRISKGAAALSAAGLLLLLTACGGGDNASPEPGEDLSGAADESESEYTYSFELGEDAIEDNPFTAPDKVVVQLPEELLEVAPTQAEQVLIDSFTLEAHVLDSPEVCALDVTPHYVNSGETLIKSPIMRDGELYVQDDSEAPDAGEEIYPSDQERFVVRLGLESHDLFLVDELPSDEDLVAKADNEQVYVLAGFEGFTLVGGCQSELDSNMTVGLDFPFEEGDANTFASFSAFAMADGTIVINENYVDDFELDATGSWVAS